MNISLKRFRYLFTGTLVVALMHVSNSITSKEEVSPHLPVALAVQNNFIDEFDKMAREMFRSSHAPGAAIVIVKNGRIIYGEGFGVKKVGTMDSINIHTTFRIGSVSKTFAGVLTSKLVAQGKLNWDDHVQKYYPEFHLRNPAYAQGMEIKHILSQSTGLIQHAYTNYIEEGMPLNSMISSLSDVKLLAEPGKLYSYQNVAYGTIEPIVASATGQDYNTLIKDEIFKPLGMKNASLDYVSMMANDNIAYPNFPRRGGWSAGRISKTYYNVASAGGVNASISDMGNYLIALTGHRPHVISRKMLDDIFEPQVNTRIRWKYFSRWKEYKKSYYGLGWRIVNNASSTIAFHSGYVNGFRSQLALDIDGDIGICILTNSPTNYSSELVPAFLKLYNEYSPRLQAELDSQIALTSIKRRDL